MSANELVFFESLVRLEHLYCEKVITGGAVLFEENLKTEGGPLLPVTFRTLKSLEFTDMDCVEATSKLIRELKCLEELVPCSFDSTQEAPTGNVTFSFLASLVEDPDCKLKFLDWKEFPELSLEYDPKQLLGLLASCSDKGIMIKNFSSDFLTVQLCNDKGEIDYKHVFDAETGEQVFQVNYQRNAFIGNVIYSMEGLQDTLFLLETLPHLEKLFIYSTDTDQDEFKIWKRHGIPQWPNLRKLDIRVDETAKDGESRDLVKFLCEDVERPKLEEFALRFDWDDNGNFTWWPLPEPAKMAKTFRNLTRLALENCVGNSGFFLELWEGLGLLESVELVGCRNLGNRGFIGYSTTRESTPDFLKLKSM